MTGAELITQERQRQIDEGYTIKGDQKYQRDQLSLVAISYILAIDEKGSMPLIWPWNGNTWKPKSREENLIRAGALIAAELDRIHNLE